MDVFLLLLTCQLALFCAEEMEWRREFEEQYLEREREAMEGEGTASQPRGSCRAS